MIVEIEQVARPAKERSYFTLRALRPERAALLRIGCDHLERLGLTHHR
jgi:hypothetical protein